MRRCALLLLAIAAPFTLRAQGASLPNVVTDGFHAYQVGGSDSAVRVWTRNWSGDDSGKVAALEQSLRAVGQQFGAMQGFQVVRSSTLGDRLRRTYLLIWYERHPLYAFFQSYRLADGAWKIIDLTWDSDWAKVFPAALADPASDSASPSARTP